MKKKRGRPRSAEPRHQLALRLNPELAAALARAVQASRRTTTEEIRIAIEDHLRSLGYWPPPDFGNGQKQSQDIS